MYNQNLLLLFIVLLFFHIISNYRILWKRILPDVWMQHSTSRTSGNISNIIVAWTWTGKCTPQWWVIWKYVYSNIQTFEVTALCIWKLRNLLNTPIALKVGTSNIKYQTIGKTIYWNCQTIGEFYVHSNKIKISNLSKNDTNRWEIRYDKLLNTYISQHVWRLKYS